MHAHGAEFVNFFLCFWTLFIYYIENVATNQAISVRINYHPTPLPQKVPKVRTLEVYNPSGAEFRNNFVQNCVVFSEKKGKITPPNYQRKDDFTKECDKTLHSVSCHFLVFKDNCRQRDAQNCKKNILQHFEQQTLPYPIWGPKPTDKRNLRTVR